MPSQEPLPLRRAIADNIARKRTDEWGGSQDELAEAMRWRHFEWTRSTVADVENCRRPVSLEELIGLKTVMGGALVEFLSHEGVISITPSLEIPPEGPGSWEHLFHQKPGERPPPGSVTTPEMWKRLEASFEAQKQDMAQREAERGAAKALGISPRDVVEHAFRLWRRGFTEERNRRLRMLPGDGSSRQRKGHITRQLIQEMRTEIGGET